MRRLALAHQKAGFGVHRLVVRTLLMLQVRTSAPATPRLYSTLAIPLLPPRRHLTSSTRLPLVKVVAKIIFFGTTLEHPSQRRDGNIYRILDGVAWALQFNALALVGKTWLDITQINMVSKGASTTAEAPSLWPE